MKKIKVRIDNYCVKNKTLFINNDYKSELLDCPILDRFTIKLDDICGFKVAGTSSSYDCCYLYTKYYIFVLYGKRVEYMAKYFNHDIFEV